MLQGVHLVGEDEDDVYGGFNDYNPAFDTEVSRSCFRVKRRERLYEVICTMITESFARNFTNPGFEYWLR